MSGALAASARALIVATAGDIRTIWNSQTYVGDWLIDPPALASGADLETATLISLFTDRLAEGDDQLPANNGDRRGWWADTGQPKSNYIGSRLWLLAREKQTNETRLRAEDYATEALQWMLDDRVADRIDIAAEWVALGWLELRIGIYRDEQRLFHGRYARDWQEERASAV